MYIIIYIQDIENTSLLDLDIYIYVLIARTCELTASTILLLLQGAVASNLLNTCLFCCCSPYNDDYQTY